MSKIGIETTQNVALHFPVASVGERILAFFIDCVFLIVVVAIILLELLTLGNSEYVITLTMIFFIPLAFYSFIAELLFNGQTLGKRIMNIKVCNVDGDTPTILSYFIRWMFRLIDIFFSNGLVAVLVIILGEKGQRLGDLLAKTVVVKMKGEIKLTETIYADLADNYELVFPQAEQLVDRDIELFNKVLAQLSSSMEYTDNLVFGLNARKKITDKLGIVTDMEPEQFFKTLINDYNYLNREK